MLTTSPSRSWAGLVRLLLIVLGGLAGAALPALAQSTPSLQLAVHRDFGYGGGDQIQGLFTLEALGPGDLATATFSIDDQVISRVTAAPFRVQFDTGRYSLGWHTLRLSGVTAAGAALSAPDRRYEFVDPSVGPNVALQLGGTIFGALAVVLVIVVGAQVLIGRIGKRRVLPLGAPRRYGLKGGAICPKCTRPFGIHLLSVNALTGVFDYCPHCGRWSFVKPATREQLAAAEQAERGLAEPETPVPVESAADKLKRQIDDTRYTD